MSAPTESVGKLKMSKDAKKRKLAGKKSKSRTKIAKIEKVSFTEIDFKFLVKDDKTVLDGNPIFAHSCNHRH